MKKYGPVCPNHKVTLIDLPFPLPSKGVGICPVSGCPFEFEIDLDEDETTLSVDKFGKPMKEKKFKVTGEEK